MNVAVCGEFLFTNRVIKTVVVVISGMSLKTSKTGDTFHLVLILFKIYFEF